MAGIRDALAALLGFSAYQRGDGYGPSLGDPSVERLRESYGGNLAPAPTTVLRWYLADLETAQAQADNGDLRMAAQLYRAMRRDGTISGLLGTLTSGLVALPKRFYGAEGVAELRARNGSRSVFDDMIPPSEAALVAADGAVLGVAVAERVPVPGRSFPITIRLEPEFLQYRQYENRWYYLSIAGPLPITPGDGRWVLHTPGGRLSPWMSGLIWPLGQAFINKQHALLHRANYIAKLANAARVAFSPLGATEAQQQTWFQRVMAWGANTVFGMTPGYDVKLLESNGRGWEVFQQDIDTSDREATIAIAGQLVTTDGGAGFQNSDIHRTIRSDIIKAIGAELAHTFNTQCLPPYIAAKYGPESIPTGANVEYDVSRPKDLKAEADSMGAAADAIDKMGAVLAKYRRVLDIDELTTRFGVPILGDSDGDGIPDREPDVDALGPEAFAESEDHAEARRRATRGRWPALREAA